VVVEHDVTQLTKTRKTIYLLRDSAVTP